MPSVSGEAEHGTPSDDTERTMSMNASHGSFVTRACCPPFGVYSADVLEGFVCELVFWPCLSCCNTATVDLGLRLTKAVFDLEELLELRLGVCLDGE